jgi:hypothetical protein
MGVCTSSLVPAVPSDPSAQAAWQSHSDSSIISLSSPSSLPSACHIFIDFSNFYISALQTLKQQKRLQSPVSSFLSEPLTNNQIKHKKRSKSTGRGNTLRSHQEQLSPNSPDHGKLSSSDSETCPCSPPVSLPSSSPHGTRSRLKVKFNINNLMELFIKQRLPVTKIIVGSYKQYKSSKELTNNLSCSIGFSSPHWMIEWTRFPYLFSVYLNERLQNSIGNYVESKEDSQLHALITSTILQYSNHQQGRIKHVLILVTGDGNHNHGSTSFPLCVESALKLGWLVELYAWKVGLSKEFIRLQTKWKQSMKIIHLDEFIEEIIIKPENE